MPRNGFLPRCYCPGLCSGIRLKTAQHHTQSAVGDFIESGEYTGDGGTPLVVSGLSVDPVFVWINRKGAGAGTLANFWTTDLIVDNNAAGLSFTMGSNADLAQIDKIVALGTASFSVDGGADPNVDGADYEFIVIGPLTP